MEHLIAERPDPSPAVIRALLFLPILGAAAGWGLDALLHLSEWSGTLPISHPRVWRVLSELSTTLIYSTAALPPYLPVLVMGATLARRWSWDRLRRAVWLLPIVHLALALPFTEFAITGFRHRVTDFAGWWDEMRGIAAAILVVGYAYVVLGSSLVWAWRRLVSR